LFQELGKSFKTTNCIESLMALLAQKTDKVDYWRNSDQKHRWLAAVSGVNYFSLPTTIIIPDSPLASKGISSSNAG
jgi:hypothetical protein